MWPIYALQGKVTVSLSMRAAYFLFLFYSLEAIGTNSYVSFGAAVASTPQLQMTTPCQNIANLNWTFEVKFESMALTRIDHLSNCIKLKRSLSPESPIWNRLSHLFPETSHHRKDPQPLSISVEKFEDDLAPYGAIYSNEVDRYSNSIRLSETSFQSQTVLNARLAHELVHHLMFEGQWPSWFQEMVGILVENEIDSEKESYRIEVARDLYFWPTLFLNSESFKTPEIYPALTLFGNYLRKHFGGWLFFRKILQAGPPLENSETLDIFEKMRVYETKLQKGGIEFSMLLSLKRLWKHFIVALHLNQRDSSVFNLYQVPNWKGFSNMGASLAQVPNKISTLGFVRVNSKTISAEQRSQLNQKLSLYYFRKDSQKFNLGDNLENISNWSPEAGPGTIVLYNSTNEEQPIFSN